MWSCLLLLLVAAVAGAAPAAAQRSRVEVYGFSVGEQWRGYDWDVLTTVAWGRDPRLVQLANANGARVEISAGDVGSVLRGGAARRRAWVRGKVAEVAALRAASSGINFDFEDPLQPGDPAAAAYTRLVAETAAQLRAALPGARVSVDIPWTPDADGRHYDWAGLAVAADLLFVMAYDTRSQVLGRCIAAANSPLDALRVGLARWLGELRLPRAKLVLGLPWYGYDYPCLHTDAQPAAPDADFCSIQAVPFRGVSCSDAAGAQRCFSEIMALLRPPGRRNTTAVRWDTTQSSPYFNYRADDGRIHQVWFDDARSLELKAGLAAELGLAGIGFWNLDCLDASSPQTAAMWRAVRRALARFQQQQQLSLQQLSQQQQRQQHAGSIGSRQAAPPAVQS